MLRTQILIPERLKHRLEKRAEKQGVSMGELIRKYSEEKLDEISTISPVEALINLSKTAKKGKGNINSENFREKYNELRR